MNKKYWTELDEEKRLCELWLLEPLLNPETGYPINRNGPTFLYWKETCKKNGLKSRPIITNVMSWRKCQEWKLYPTINPETGKKIKIDGKKFKMIEKQCKLINDTEKEIDIIGEYFIPDKNGMVPCTLVNNTIYVNRTIENRSIWGPLNKPVKKVSLQFYKDAWDYKNNFYKPIFMDNQPVKKVFSKSPQNERSERATSYRNSNGLALLARDRDGTSFIVNKTYNDIFIKKNNIKKNDPKYLVDNILNLFI